MKDIENCLKGQGQWVVISGSNIVSQGATLVPNPFNIIINDLGDGGEHTLSNFVGGTKLGVVADTPDGCAVTQRDLDGLTETS